MRKAKGKAYEDDGPNLGRRTIDDDWLSANRDSIINLLCSWWPEIGWQLTTARTREAVIEALQPVKDHPNRQLIDRLLRPTKASASAPEIRRKREVHREAVRSMNNAREECDKCMTACRQIELAMMQAIPSQIDVISREFSARRVGCQQAQDQLRAAITVEKRLKEELLDKEAAFAQDELLTFIGDKRKYALNPLNLANAMAGLPFDTAVPFIGVWQSHARCSQLACPMWPSYHYQEFETVESIWERAEHSSISRLEFFQQQIKVLPKMVLQTHPTLGTLKIENYVRKHLADNWWYLQRAIEESVRSADDPRPMPFRICAIFHKLLANSGGAAESVLAEAARIQ